MNTFSFSDSLPFVYTLFSNNMSKFEDNHGVRSNSFCHVDHFHFILRSGKKKTLHSPFDYLTRS